ncbi:estradiol 17-beta-dehydrogenase 11-like [Aphelocoma coerulescens]|uniref:estradiol 17-beta-dehydrogenase 11-like n=1 Tax=Aphelocoma coerulescens TaxID=39617 RepID=UPI003604EC1A
MRGLHTAIVSVFLSQEGRKRPKPYISVSTPGKSCQLQGEHVPARTDWSADCSSSAPLTQCQPRHTGIGTPGAQRGTAGRSSRPGLPPRPVRAVRGGSCENGREQRRALGRAAGKSATCVPLKEIKVQFGPQRSSGKTMHLFLELLLFLATLLYSYLEAFVKLFVPVRRKSLSGELVLITGAGHGVGRATALEFAKRQSRLVLWDINKHGVEETAAECQKLGATVQTFVVDCSKREEIYSAADKVKKEIGDVTILVNNAGVITAADFLSTQDHQIERMFEVNILGHMWTTRAFLPVMMNNNYGHIVTVASAAGHFVIPFMVAYCSSKFAAVGFHKALTEELSALGKDGIKTTCLCPVFINTGFVKNPTVRLGKILEIEEVVEALMEGIVTNQKMVFVPSNQSVGLLLERVFPERALNLLRKMTDVKFDAVIGQRSTQ